MKKLFTLILLVAIMVIGMSCTENQRARGWGGNADVTIQAGYKVMNVTWKDNDLWILVEPMPIDYTPRTLTFYEKSGWGVLNGKFTIYESKVPLMAVTEVTIVPDTVKLQ